MPRNGSGTYTLPQAAFVPGTTISSSAMNSDLSDIAAALTQSVSADGQTPFTGTFKNIGGTAGNPSYTFTTDTTTGMYLSASGVIGFANSGLTTIKIQAPSSSGAVIVGPTGQILQPVGMIVDFAGSTAPNGWLLCFGQVVSQTTYAYLFNVIGTTFNTGGEGAGNFRLPDLRGNVGAGVDNMGGSAANRITGGTLGVSGGEQNHTLITNEIPSHSHSNTLNDPGHVHSFFAMVSGVGSYAGASGAGATGPTTQNTNSATTGITINNVNAGGGAAHNNLQPTLCLNKIIYTGVT